MIGSNIQSRRRAIGLTQEQLAERLGVARQTVAMPPRGKHLFGTVTVGERGQIVIPKQARELFGIEAGDALLVLGDEEQGLAILKAAEFMDRVSKLLSMIDR